MTSRGPDRAAGWRRFVRFWARDVDGDIRDELQFHLDMREREYQDRGIAPDQATLAAQQRFGDVGSVESWLRAHDHRQDRGERRREFMYDLLRDTRIALRQLRSAPGFAGVAIITFGLAIGATTSVLSIINGVLLKPLPFAAPEQLMRLTPSSRSLAAESISPLDFIDVRAQTRSFTDVAAMDGGLSGTLIRGGTDPLRLDEARVSANFFSTLGVRAQVGRLFLAGDDAQSAPLTVVLSDATWRTLFGADPGVVGTQVVLNGTAATILGVAPRTLRYPGYTAIWIPLVWTSSEMLPDNRAFRELDAIARRKPGVSPDQANSDLARFTTRQQQAYPQLEEGYRVSATSLADFVVGNVRAPLVAMLGAVAFVLLIACANVANLLLARAVTRQAEMAVRTALGAGRLRLVRQLLTESTLLAMAGAAVGMAIAASVVRAVARFGPVGVPRLADVTVDGRVLLITTGIAIVTGLFFGLAPAVYAVRTDLAPMLRAGGRTGRSEGSQRFRSGLVIAEMALAVVLLVGAGLLLRSFVRLLDVDPGFRPEQVVAFDAQLPREKYPYDLERRAFATEVMDRLRQLPQVEVVAVAAERPIDPQASFDAITGFHIIGTPELAAGEEGPSAAIFPVSPDYFRALGIRMLRGRTFTTSEDRTDGPQAVVVSEALVKKYFPHDDPLGKELVFGIRHHISAAEADSFRSHGTIVGVVADVHAYALSVATGPAAYLAYNTVPFGVSIMVRTPASLRTLAPAIRAAVRAVDPSIPVYGVTTLTDAVSLSVAQPRFYTTLLAAFAALALAIAALGTHGVLAYMVTQRRRELGIRIALGASRGRIAGGVVGNALLLTGTGLLIGTAGAVALSRGLAAMLFDVSPLDAVALLGSCAVLLCAGLLAAWIPARRAARVDPMVAIRAE